MKLRIQIEKNHFNNKQSVWTSNSKYEIPGVNKIVQYVKSHKQWENFQMDKIKKLFNAEMGIFNPTAGQSLGRGLLVKNLTLESESTKTRIEQSGSKEFTTWWHGFAL